ncbi:hypothetical protein E3Q22_02541 [Wallemia mellicola]|uniref:Uncharacterized protein n=1 Tax=Wallemia mellicola TaxID=1708541 RepID=A0A4T0M7G9_9BASI|nr:hypothetical protein E3Q22_02541 [Wallemia mellicola]
MTFNPPNNFYHLKAVELRDFIDNLVKTELNKYNIINDTKQPSLPIAWGVYSEDEQSEESEEEPIEEDPPNVNPPVDYRPKVFNSNAFLNHLKIFSETNPILPLNTPTIYSKRSRFQKKRLTRKEQELLEKEPYLKNADVDTPWSIIPTKWQFNTPFLQPICKPPNEDSFRPLYLPSLPGFYFKYATNNPQKQSQQQQQQQQPQSQQPSQQPSTQQTPDQINDGARQATVLDYGAFQHVPSILCGHNENFIKTAYHVEGDAMIHAMSKRINEEFSHKISNYLNDKLGHVKPDSYNGNWEVFYRNYLHDQIQNSKEFIDDIFFGGVQGKAYLNSILNYIQEIINESNLSPDDPRSQLLIQRLKNNYFEQISDHYTLLEDIQQSFETGNLDNLQPSFDYYDKTRIAQIRNLAFKAYLRSSSAKVDCRKLLFDENVKDLSKSDYREIHDRPETDPAGVLDYIKSMAEKINQDALKKSSSQPNEYDDGLKMEVDDSYSDNENQKDIFKVVAPPIPKPASTKRSKRASRSSTVKKQQVQQMHVDESPQNEFARISLLKVALKLPSNHLSSI